jgi:hypothetical protein
MTGETLTIEGPLTRLHAEHAGDRTDRALTYSTQTIAELVVEYIIGGQVDKAIFAAWTLTATAREIAWRANAIGCTCRTGATRHSIMCPNWFVNQ